MDVTQIVRGDPSYSARLVNRQSEVHSIRVLDHQCSLHTAESAEGVSKQSQPSHSGLVIGDHVVALEIAALGAERSETPVQTPLPIEVHRGGVDVVEDAAEPASLEGAD